MSVREGSGIIATCPVCGKVWYIDPPEMWVPKREINTNGSRKTVYFCKSSHKWEFDDKYEEERERKRSENAAKRHEELKKKHAEGKKASCGRKKTTLEERKKAAEEREGKTCTDCRYALKDRFGFWNCSFQYNCKPFRKACGCFKPKDEGVMYG